MLSLTGEFAFPIGEQLIYSFFGCSPNGEAELAVGRFAQKGVIMAKVKYIGDGWQSFKKGTIYDADLNAKPWDICEICEENVASGVMCDDGVWRCIGCAEEDGFDIQTGMPAEIAAQHPLHSRA